MVGKELLNEKIREATANLWSLFLVLSAQQSGQDQEIRSSTRGPSGVMCRPRNCRSALRTLARNPPRKRSDEALLLIWPSWKRLCQNPGPIKYTSFLGFRKLVCGFEGSELQAESWKSTACGSAAMHLALRCAGVDLDWVQGPRCSRTQTQGSTGFSSPRSLL